jgi:hypothetical protein
MFNLIFLGDFFSDELDTLLVEWFIHKKLHEGNHSPLLNEPVIKDIYDKHPHLYEDDVIGIKMSKTQVENKQRRVLRFCSQEFNSFLRKVFGIEKYKTILFA